MSIYEEEHLKKSLLVGKFGHLDNQWDVSGQPLGILAMFSFNLVGKMGIFLNRLVKPIWK